MRILRDRGPEFSKYLWHEITLPAADAQSKSELGYVRLIIDSIKQHRSDLGNPEDDLMAVWGREFKEEVAFEREVIIPAKREMFVSVR
jgi:hypothetical protein